MKKPAYQNGSIILVVLITMPFLILMTIYFMQLAITSMQVARLDQLHTEAQLAADAGADYAIQQLGADNTWTGTTGEYTVHDDGKLCTKFTANLTGDDTAKEAAIVGRAYWPTCSGTARRTVKIKLDLRPVTSGNFSVISGAGGLIMTNSSKVVGGAVFINGTITMSNTAQIGLTTKPVSVKVAHQFCPEPADASYPRVCAAGEDGEPINITSPNAHIYGEVKATNQTDGSNMSSPGLVSGTVDPEPLPTHDRDSQKAAATNMMTAADASCSGNTTKTWPANTKITGDVTVSNKCKVTVEGDVWVTGSLNIRNNDTKLIVANSLGTSRPHIMVDAAAGISISNSAGLTTNSVGTGFEFITFHSTASCSPDCASVTGVDLANSRSITTITIDTSGDAANSVFYAYWTQVSLANSGQIGALIGQTIRLSNSGTITFGSSISTGAQVTWVVKGYRRG